MKKVLVAIIIVLVAIFFIPVTYAQHTALKTDVLYWATTTPNISFETRLSPKWTFDASVGYNPFTYGENKKLKHLLVRPEARYWLCSAYSGHFLGANLLYSHYNVGNIDMPLGLCSELKDHRFQGDLGAVGVVYGYSWMLGRRWSLEASAGIGIGLTSYKKYLCEICGTQVETDTRWIVMPTRLSLSLVYYIR